MNKTNEDSQRSKSVLRKSSRIIRLPGDNSRDAEAPKPWSKAESLLKLLTEKLPSGFSIEEFDVDTHEDKFTFMVSFPKSAAKGLEPPDTNVVYVKGGGDIDASYIKSEPSVGYGWTSGWDIEISYVGGFYFVNDDGKETRIDQRQSKIINDIMNRNFEDEFLDRIKNEFEDNRTAYRGESMEGERTPIPKELQHLHWTELQRLWNPKTKKYDYDKERPSPELAAIRAKRK